MEPLGNQPEVVRRGARGGHGVGMWLARSRRSAEGRGLDLEQDRPRLACARSREGGAGRRGDLAGRAHLEHALHERGEDVRLPDRLEPGRAVGPRPGSGVDDVHERHRVQKCLGHSRDRISESRSGDGGEHGRPPGRARVPVRHERGRELARRTDDTDPRLAPDCLPDVDERGPGDAEDVLDSGSPELRAQDLGAGPSQEGLRSSDRARRAPPRATRWAE